MSLFKQSKQQGGKDGWKLDQNWPCFVLIIMLIFAQGQVAHVFVATPNCTQPPIVAHANVLAFHWSAQHAQPRKSPRDVGQAIKDALPAEAAELFEEAIDFGKGPLSFMSLVDTSCMMLYVHIDVYIITVYVTYTSSIFNWHPKLTLTSGSRRPR